MDIPAYSDACSLSTVFHCTEARVQDEVKNVYKVLVMGLIPDIIHHF
jgi:hypothetical protein